MFLTRRALLTSAALSAFAQTPATPLKIVVAGGHPGDPECGCGGTIARYTALGHDVVLLYLNRGEGYCQGSDPTQCGAIRTLEAQKACQILKARPAFAAQYDGRAIVDNAHYDDFRRILDGEKPDIIFTQWPIDSHRDHRAVSTLVLDAWLRGRKQSALYFYEVYENTMMFAPTHFVDISGVETQRKTACFAHVSQQPGKWYPGQSELTRRRGKEKGYTQAEAFVRHEEGPLGFLP